MRTGSNFQVTGDYKERLSSLVEKGLLLVGLDIIGDYLTEINVTSPTCFKEYKELCDIDVAKTFIEAVEEFTP